MLAGCAVVVLDQTFKHLASSTLKLYQRVELLPADLFAFTRVHNLGVAGDRFSGLEAGEIEFYTRYAPTAIWALLLTMYLFRRKEASALERTGFWLMLAAGGSNLFDHWRNYFVVDTFQIWVGGRTFVPFNLADAGLIAGFALMGIAVLREFFGSNASQQRATAAC